MISNNIIITTDLSLVYGLKFEDEKIINNEDFIKKTICFYCNLKMNLKNVNAYLHTIRQIDFNRENLLKQTEIIDLKSKGLVSERMFDDILDRIHLYEEYEILGDCCSDTIKRLNIDIINKPYLHQNKKYFGLGNRALAEKIYYHLLNLFYEHVSQRHSNIIYEKKLENSEGIKIVPNIKWSELKEAIFNSDVILDESTPKKKGFVLK